MIVDWLHAAGTWRKGYIIKVTKRKGRGGKSAFAKLPLDAPLGDALGMDLAGLDLDGTEDVSSRGSGVGLSVPDATADDGSTDESGASDSDTGEGNGREELGDLDGHLLRAVGEVVVAGGHEVEGTGGAGSADTAVEQGLGSVQVVAVLEVLIVVVVVASGGGVGLAALDGVVVGLLCVGADAGLILVGELESERGGPELGILDAIGVVGASVSVHTLLLDDGHQVGAIVLVATVTGLTSGVVVGTSPLEVDVVCASDLELVGREIVLYSWVALNNVSSASSNIQVEDARSWLYVSWTLGDLERVRAVLEGTSELVGVDVESQVSLLSLRIGSEVHVGVVGDWRLLLSVERGVNHLRLLLIDVSEAIVVS